MFWGNSLDLGTGRWREKGLNSGNKGQKQCSKRAFKIKYHALWNVSHPKVLVKVNGNSLKERNRERKACWEHKLTAGWLCSCILATDAGLSEGSARSHSHSLSCKRREAHQTSYVPECWPPTLHEQGVGHWKGDILSHCGLGEKGGMFDSWYKCG